MSSASKSISEQLAVQLKEAGNDAFQVNDYEKAIELYTKSLGHFFSVGALCNRALALLKSGRWLSFLLIILCKLWKGFVF
jgi:hypothetical protein